MHNRARAGKPQTHVRASALLFNACKARQLKDYHRDLLELCLPTHIYTPPSLQLLYSVSFRRDLGRPVPGGSAPVIYPPGSYSATLCRGSYCDNYQQGATVQYTRDTWPLLPLPPPGSAHPQKGGGQYMYHCAYIIIVRRHAIGIATA